MNYELAFLFGVIAFVYSNLLTQPEHLLAWWYRFWFDFFKGNERIMSGKPRHPLFMVIVHCEKCIAGEFALWYYLYHHYNDYDFIYHISFISLSILFASCIRGIYFKYISNE